MLEKLGKTALVVGATGAVGRELVAQLCSDESYERVVAWVRREPNFSHEKLKIKVVNFDAILAIEPEKFDEIYCALGTTMAQAKSRENFAKIDFEYVRDLALWGKSYGALKFILISAPHANENSKNFYLQTKGKAQNSARNANFNSLIICQAPLIDAARHDKRFGEAFLIWLFRFLPKNCFKDYRPLSADQIAKAVIKVAKTNNEKELVIKPHEIKI